jgi:hypothetical protein
MTKKSELSPIGAIVLPPFFLLGAFLYASPATPQSRAGSTGKRTPMESKTTEHQGSGATTGTIRTPEDIEKDRNIVPDGGTPVAVPNRSTIPKDQDPQMRQGNTNRIRHTPDGNDSQK